MNDSDFPTIIGSDAKFKGELAFEKGVKIMGGFEGRILTKGSLVVSEQGVINADIEAGSIVVEGEISGNVAANDLVELKDTARLQGDLTCGRLIVTDGARFVGHCNVGGNGQARLPQLGQEAVTSEEEPDFRQQPIDESNDTGNYNDRQAFDYNDQAGSNY